MGMTKGTGCQFDHEPIWSNTPCGCDSSSLCTSCHCEGCVLTHPGSPDSLGSVPRQCTPIDSQSPSTRCCADHGARVVDGVLLSLSLLCCFWCCLSLSLLLSPSLSPSLTFPHLPSPSLTFPHLPSPSLSLHNQAKEGVHTRQGLSTRVLTFEPFTQ